MSDLISRSELLKAMDTWDKFGYDEHNRLIRIDSTNEEYVPYVHYEDIVNCVKAMTTAYDINKVVEELESEKRYGSKYDSYYEENLYRGEMFENDINNKTIDNAIEIVKHSGVDDDVCEWAQSGDMAINPHTFSKYKIKQCDDLYALSTCPYCRKKIKVVE